MTSTKVTTKGEPVIDATFDGRDDAGAGDGGMSKFAAALRSARARANLSLADVGERIGKNRSTISRWEQGRSMPGRKEVAALERCFGIEDGSLLLAARYIPDTPGPGGTIDLTPYLVGLDRDQQRAISEAVRLFVEELARRYRDRT